MGSLAMSAGREQNPFVKQEEVPAEPIARPRNLLSYNRPFDAVGSTASVDSEPTEVHFHGFLPGQPLQQLVQLRNGSKTRTRVIVVPPATSNFKVLSTHGAGYLAPGLSQQLLVEFTGQQLQRYDDTILVHTEAGGLAIPLHASPASSCPQLPKHLDLGHVPLGQTLTHQLQLSCTAATSFPFSITVLQHNKHFNVQPLSGTVPAQGSTTVTICFTPTRYSTERLELSVLLAEDNAQPMHMHVTASCKPGLMQQLVLTAAQQGQPDKAGVAGGAKGGSRRSPDQAARSPTALRGSPTAAQSSPKRRAPGSPSQLPAAILAQHSSQHEVNMLLNQRPGKLMTKDIKAAIVARKQELAREQANLQAALDAGVASGIDPLDQPEVQPHIKEALFQLQLSQAEAGGRHGQGQGSVKESARVGRTHPTADEVAAMTAARAAVLEKEESQRQQAAVHRLQVEMSTSGAVHVLPDADQPSSSPQAGNNSSWACSYPGLERFQPQWLLLSESNDWRKRVQVVQRFVQAARVVVYRNRAQARLKKLRALAGKRAHLGGSREGLAGEVLQSVMVEGSVVQRPGLPPTQLMAPDKVRPTELPVLCAQAYVPHAEVDKGLYGDFSVLQPQPYKAEFEYVQLGYSTEEVPALLPYVPQCQQQPLLPGAPEDLPGGMQVGLLPASVSTLASMEGMPDGLLGNPYTSNSHASSVQFNVAAPAWGLVPRSSHARSVLQTVVSRQRG